MATTATVEVATHEISEPPVFPVRAQSKQYPVPEEMRAESRWVVWRIEIHDDKLKKVPFCARTDERADITDPSTWCSYAEAEALAATERYDGLGFVLGDRWVGIDLDGVINPDTQRLTPWAEEIVKELATYTEISPSGIGIHQILKGEMPGDRHRAGCPDGQGHIEIYGAGRYFTVTGNRWPGTPPEIANGEGAQEALNRVYSSLFPSTEEQPAADREPTHHPLSDADVLTKARSSRNGAAFSRLYDDGHRKSDYPSQSEADQALCLHLAFWTGGDAVQMDRLFRQSGLYRKKWDEKRGAQTYGEKTIAKAVRDCTKFYVPRARTPRPRAIRVLLRAHLSASAVIAGALWMLQAREGRIRPDLHALAKKLPRSLGHTRKLVKELRNARLLDILQDAAAWRFVLEIEAVLRDAGLLLTYRVVYLCIASFAREGVACVSQARLARETGLSLGTIGRAVDKLKAAGCLSVLRAPYSPKLGRPKQLGRRERGNEYILTPPELASEDCLPVRAEATQTVTGDT